MSESIFSDELRTFTASEIQSVEQLEILLLLSGNPDRWWSTKMVYEVIKSNPASVAARMEAFARNMILKRAEMDGITAYRFAPESEAVATAVSELRDAYKDRPVKVIEAIYSKRSDPVKEFARAFKLKKEK